MTELEKARNHFKRVIKRGPDQGADEWAIFWMANYATFLKQNENPKNPKERKDAIIQMHHNGMRNTDIAKKLNVTRSYVGKILKKLVNKS